MTASTAHRLSSFRGEQPFDPVRNPCQLPQKPCSQPGNSSPMLVFRCCPSPQKPSLESKECSVTPAGSRAFLEKQQGKNVPWRIKLLFSLCGLYFLLSWYSTFQLPNTINIPENWHAGSRFYIHPGAKFYVLCFQDGYSYMKNRHLQHIHEVTTSHLRQSSTIIIIIIVIIMISIFAIRIKINLLVT